jgi:nucleotidyltransferase/DNA polymerase involved in DNA repair
MDLSVGNAFPAPAGTERLHNQVGHLEHAARSVARRATNLLAHTGVWRKRTPESAPSQIDLTDKLKQLQSEMLLRTGVRIALGAARSKVVAGTASRLAGAGVPHVVLAGQERAFLAPLPLQSLYGLPGATLHVLRASGMVTIGELQRVPKAVLQAEFGEAEGLRLWRSARGLDPLECGGLATRRTERVVDPETLLLAGTLRKKPSWQNLLGLRGQIAAAIRGIAFQDCTGSGRGPVA